MVYKRTKGALPSQGASLLPGNGVSAPTRLFLFALVFFLSSQHSLSALALLFLRLTSLLL